MTASAGDLAAGPLSAEPSAAALAVDRLTRSTCAAAWSLADGDRAGADVYVVGVYPEAGRAQQFNHFPSAREIQRFLAGNETLLHDPANAVVTRCAHDRGDCHSGDGALNCELGVARATKDKNQALRLAHRCNQPSIGFLGKQAATVIDRDAGQPLGDGRDLSGAALAACTSARDAAAK